MLNYTPMAIVQAEIIKLLRAEVNVDAEELSRSLDMGADYIEKVEASEIFLDLTEFLTIVWKLGFDPMNIIGECVRIHRKLNGEPEGLPLDGAHSQAIASFIRRIRIEAGKSQAWLGEAIGKSRSFIARIERTGSLLEMNDFLAIAEALGLSSTEALERLMKDFPRLD
jgi:hypothetical protein